MLEKLIETLVALVAALNDNTKALREGVKPALPEAAPANKTPELKKVENVAQPTKLEPPLAKTPPADKTPEPAASITLQDVRAAAQAVLDNNGNDPSPITALNKKYGVKRISEVAPEKYAEAEKALRDIVAKLKEGSSV